ncbi:MAG: nodulation protein NfeD [Phycisphaerales bacterium]
MTQLKHQNVGSINPFRTVALIAACMLLWSNALAAQNTPNAIPTFTQSVPAYRQADKVVVITLEGAIDSITAMSIARRVELAETGGADAIVLEIDSPGGEVGAVLEITNAIKGSSIQNTVAWINPDAYSGGAIAALACREIVANSPASMGDAFPVTMTPVQGQNRMGLRSLTPDERTKILPVLMTDVTDSARRAGWDEYLVQAIIIDGVELWWVQDTRTGQKLAVNEAEYEMLFDRKPVRGKPILAGVTGGVSTAPPQTQDGSPTSSDADSNATTSDDAQESDPGDTDSEPSPERDIDAGQGEEPDTSDDVIEPSGELNERAFQPASESLRDIEREFNSPERTDLRIELPSGRPVLTPADAGSFRDLGYLCDGSSAVVMREDQLAEFGFSNAIIRNDEELKAYFGAIDLIRVNESWSEGFVRFMTGMAVRGVLIAVMLIALFLEMMSPGLTVPGAVAALCLVLLLAPPALIGMAGWWEIVAIVIGILLIAVEIFVIPGFGVFGVLGIVGLFGGLLGTFIPAGGSLADPATQADLARGVMVLVLALVTAGIGMYMISRNFDRIPIFDKLILDDTPSEQQSELDVLYAAGPETTERPEVGMTGVAITVLRPSGEAEIDGRLVDVVANLGYLEAGTRVRVVKVEGMRVVVGEVKQSVEDRPPAEDQEGTA